MARTIQSPGVQIQEIDLSLANAGVPATTVFVPGFAAKGPSSEPITITSLSEFEQVFGTPTNAAERYFYHSAKAVLNSPANVLVYRLPYGTGSGVDTSEEYSALIYPVAGYSNGSVTNNLAFSAGSYFFGTPTHLKLTQSEYLSILRGDGFEWSPTTDGTISFNTVSSLGKAGMIILNKSQSTVNTKFEGTYIGLIDNTNLNPATPFNDVNKVYSLNSTTRVISNNNDYTEIPQVRLTLLYLLIMQDYRDLYLKY